MKTQIVVKQCWINPMLTDLTDKNLSLYNISHCKRGLLIVKICKKYFIWCRKIDYCNGNHLYTNIIYHQ